MTYQIYKHVAHQAEFLGVKYVFWDDTAGDILSGLCSQGILS